MATTLATLRQELSKELGDYWASSLTSNGNAGGTTIVDTVLTDKDADWVASPAGEDEPTNLVTSGTYSGQERPISSLATNTLTVKRAYGGQILSGVTYEIHKLFTAEEKQNALIFAARAVFPILFKKVLDNTFTTGNWVRNGDFEDWTVSTYPDIWRNVTVTAASNTNTAYIARGSKSCRLSTASGYIWTGYNTTTQLLTDLWQLAEQSIEFKVWGWCDTASQLRIAFYDGTTITYSDYHAGDSVLRELTLTHTIPRTATAMEFRIYYGGTGNAYVDNARVKCPTRNRFTFDISGLGLFQNKIHKISRELDRDNPTYPYKLLRDWEVTSDGILRFNKLELDNYKMRIEGIGYLSVSSTASLDLDAPQTLAVQARAAQYLFENTINSRPSQDVERYIMAAQRWAKEYDLRRMLYWMQSPVGTVHY